MVVSQGVVVLGCGVLCRVCIPYYQWPLKLFEARFYRNLHWQLFDRPCNYETKLFMCIYKGVPFDSVLRQFSTLEMWHSASARSVVMPLLYTVCWDITEQKTSVSTTHSFFITSGFLVNCYGWFSKTIYYIYWYETSTHSFLLYRMIAATSNFSITTMKQKNQNCCLLEYILWPTGLTLQKMSAALAELPSSLHPSPTGSHLALSTLDEIHSIGDKFSACTITIEC